MRSRRMGRIGWRTSNRVDVVDAAAAEAWYEEHAPDAVERVAGDLSVHGKAHEPVSRSRGGSPTATNSMAVA